MIRRMTICGWTFATFAFVMSITQLVWAHEGHERKLMGTLTMVAVDHVMVRTTAGKEHTISLKNTTKVTHGKMPMKPADLKTGTRVVVTATGDKEPYAAKEIKLGVTTTPAPVKENK